MLQKFHILDINTVIFQFTNYFMASAYILIVITITFNQQLTITKLVLSCHKNTKLKFKVNKNYLPN
jgi:hypothetical protein